MNIPALIFIFIFTAIYGAVNFYIGRRIYQGISFISPNINTAIYAAVFIFIALSLFIGLMPFPIAARRLFFWISSYWIGISVYLLMFFLAGDIVLFFGRIISANPLPHSVRFFAAVAVVLLTAIVVIYGRYNANQIHHVHHEIQTRTAAFPDTFIGAEGRDSSPDGLRIVLVSDLHLGAVNSERNLARMVQGINKLEPDIVCIVGDIFNDDIELIRNPARAIELLRSINATYGVYASLGNHDGGRTFNEMLRFLEKSNITVLKDEHTVIGERFVLIGRLDSSPIGGFGGLQRKATADILASVDTNLPIVVMDHNPAYIKEYGSEVDLILSGHTHGGQIFPFTLVTRAMYYVHHGHFQKNAYSPHVIVTSGVNTWGMPLRIGSNNEIVSILLR